MEFKDLYRQAFHGDDSAEEQLFGLLTVMFQMFMRRKGVGTEDIEDIVQGALVKIARTYRQGDIKGNFAAWAQTIVKNEFIDFCRGRTAQRRRQDELASRFRIPAASTPDPGLKDRLMACLRKLHAANPLHARIVNLHYQGFGPKEVCRRLGITANHRRVALCRARAMLWACLNEEKSQNE
jgi:RNA polymerase sigma factor (sigma-70 family)